MDNERGRSLMILIHPIIRQLRNDLLSVFLFYSYRWYFSFYIDTSNFDLISDNLNVNDNLQLTMK